MRTIRSVSLCLCGKDFGVIKVSGSMASEVDVMSRLEGASVRRHSAPALVRQVRLACGLVLLTYVALHLLNHALGLISLDAMEWGRGWFLALWRTTVGTAVLYTALLAHARARPLAHRAAPALSDAGVGSAPDRGSAWRFRCS